MNVTLKKAEINEASILHNLKIESFIPLLKIYKDFDTSPATEHLNKIVSQIMNNKSSYYIIKYKGVNVGGIRIIRADDSSCRVAPMFILPKYQNQGIAQEVFRQIEFKYNRVSNWQLDTILEEDGLCHLYEKVGYKKTGKTKLIEDRFTIVFYEKKINCDIL